MINKNSLILVVLMLFFPIGANAQEGTKVKNRIIEIQKNRLYMVPLGSQHGAKKGDIAEVVRDGIKVAEVKLTSVLPVSSMAEVVSMFNANEILELDVVKLPGQTTLTTQATKAKSAVQPASIESVKRREVFKREVKKVVSEDIKAKEAPKPKRSEVSQSDYKKMLREQKKTIEEDFRSERGQLQQKIAGLEDQIHQFKNLKRTDTLDLQSELKKKQDLINSLTNDKTDLNFELKQTKKELREKKFDGIGTDIAPLQRAYQEEISAVKEKSRQELFDEYDRWQIKLKETKDAYEAELRKQEAQITDLRNEKYGIASELGERDRDLVKLRANVASLKEEREFSKKTIEGLVIEKEQWESNFDEMQEEYEAELTLQKHRLEDKIVSGQGQLQDEITVLETELYELSDNKDLKIFSLEAQLAEKEELVRSLTKTKSNLTSDLQKTDKELRGLNKNLEQTKSELREAKKVVSKKVKSVKVPLEAKVKDLNNEVVALKKNYEEKLKSVKEESERMIIAEQQKWELKLEKNKNNYESKLAVQEKGSVLQIESLRQETAILTARLAEKKERVNELKTEFKQEKQNLENNYFGRNKELQEKVIGLNNQIIGLKENKDKEVSILVAEIARVNDEVSLLKTDRERITTSLENQLQDKDERLNSLQAKHKELQKDIQESTKNAGSLKTVISEYKNKISTIEQRSKNTIEKLSLELASLNKEYKNKLNTISKESWQALLSEQKQWQTKLEDNKIQHEREIHDLRENLEKKFLNRENRLEDEVAILAKQLDDLKKRKDNKVLMLVNDLEDKQFAINALKKDQEKLSINVRRNHRRTAELTEENTRLKEKLKIAKSSNHLKVRLAIQPLEVKVEELTSELVSLQEKYEGRIASLQAANFQNRDKHKKEVVQLTNNYEEKLVFLREGSERELQARQEQWDSKLEANKQQYKTELNLVKDLFEDKLHNRESVLQSKISSLNNQLSDLKSSKDSELSVIESSLKDQESQVKSLIRGKGDLNRAISRLKTELRSNKEAHSEKVRLAKRPLESRIEELLIGRQSLKEKYEGRIASMKEEALQNKDAFKEEKTFIKDNYEEKISFLKEQARKDLFARQDQWETKWETNQQRHEAEITQIRENLEGKLQDRENSLQTEITNLKDQLYTLRDKASLAKMLSKEKSNLKEDVTLLKRQLKSSQDTRIKKIRLAKEPLENEIAVLNAELESLKESYEEKMETFKKQNWGITDRLNIELATLKRNYEEKLSYANAESERELLVKQEQWETKWETNQQQHESELSRVQKRFEDTLQSSESLLQAEVSGLKGQLNELTELKDREVFMLETSLSDKESQVKSLTQEKSSSDRETSRLKAELKSLKNTRSEKIRLAKRPLEAKIEELNTEFKSLKERYEERIASSKAETIQTKRTFKAEMALLKEEYDDKLSAKKERTERKLLKKQQQWVSKLEANQEQYQAELNHVRRSLEDKLQNADERHKAELNQVRRSLEDKLQNRENLLRAEVTLAKQPLEAKIEKLTNDLSLLKRTYESKLAIAKEKTNQASTAVGKKWRNQLEALKEDYEEKLNLQKQAFSDRFTREETRLQDKILMLSDTISEIESSRDTQIFALETNYEDKLKALKEESRQNIDSLSQKLASLKEDYRDKLELLKVRNQAQNASSAELVLDDSSSALIDTEETLVSEQESWGNSNPKGYYSSVRNAILKNFRKFDFLSYKEQEDYVRIEFELFADGALRERPKFLGTKDEELKDLMYQYFQKALPFPPFPESIDKKSQRFTIIISFKDQ